MDTGEKRKLLGHFIRSHRERVMPDVVTPRRRTPGLRREELAVRAGIGVTWCAWIEQGREISVSSETLGRLAKALALTPAERGYMFDLADRRDPDGPRRDMDSEAPEAVSALVHALPHPAYGLDPLWNACCHNGAAEHLFVGWLDQAGSRNLLRYTFTEPAARKILPDWEQRARRNLAEFRASCARMSTDPALHDLVRELCEQSKLFAEEWENQTVMAREGGLRTFKHPTDGPLSYTQHTYSPAERPEYKVVFLVASTEG